MISNPNHTRASVDNRYKWHVNDIVKDETEFNQKMEQLKTMSSEIATYQGQVNKIPQKVIKLYFEAANVLEHLFTFARMNRDTEGGNSAYRAACDQMMTLYVAFSADTSFLKPELVAMEAETLLALINDPEMKDYEVYLRDILREKPHTLSVEEERIMAMAGELLSTPDEIYSTFTNVDLVFDNVHNEKGEEVSFAESTYSTFIQSNSREVRKEAFEVMFQTYAKYGTTISNMYAANVKGDLFSSRLRNYPSAIQAALSDNQIPLEVYDNLIEAVHESLPVLGNYLATRKDVLGVENLHMYDLYCPLIASFEMALPYEKAYELVTKGLAPLGDEYIAHIQEAFAKGWIDVFPNKGKRSGAYSTSVYGVHPFVLLNHNDTLDGAMTIAHEMGHAMHSFYSNQSQPMPKANYSIFVAEVASTCNEMLVMHYLLDAYKDNKEAKAYLLNHLLEQFRSTVFRQTMFAEFERKAHQMAEEGMPLTREALSEMYYQLNQQYYGAVCEVDELVANEWMRIPHFYSAFYVYQYATGFSAAVYLANRILTQGDSAVTDYKRFLSAGSSIPPIEALKLAGVDMSKPEAVLSAMQMFKRTLDQFKTLL